MPVELLTMAALIYLTMTFVVTRLFKLAELLLSGDRRQPPAATVSPAKAFSPASGSAQ
jgi:hypothetical protein